MHAVSRIVLVLGAGALSAACGLKDVASDRRSHAETAAAPAAALDLTATRLTATPSVWNHFGSNATYTNTPKLVPFEATGLLRPGSYVRIYTVPKWARANASYYAKTLARIKDAVSRGYNVLLMVKDWNVANDPLHVQSTADFTKAAFQDLIFADGREASLRAWLEAEVGDVVRVVAEAKADPGAARPVGRIVYQLGNEIIMPEIDDAVRDLGGMRQRPDDAARMADPVVATFYVNRYFAIAQDVVRRLDPGARIALGSVYGVHNAATRAWLEALLDLPLPAAYARPGRQTVREAIDLVTIHYPFRECDTARFDAAGTDLCDRGIGVIDAVRSLASPTPVWITEEGGNNTIDGDLWGPLASQVVPRIVTYAVEKGLKPDDFRLLFWGNEWRAAKSDGRPIAAGNWILSRLVTTMGDAAFRVDPGLQLKAAEPAEPAQFHALPLATAGKKFLFLNRKGRGASPTLTLRRVKIGGTAPQKVTVHVYNPGGEDYFDAPFVSDASGVELRFATPLELQDMAGVMLEFTLAP